jgi:hypothetical protein
MSGRRIRVWREGRRRRIQGPTEEAADKGKEMVMSGKSVKFNIRQARARFGPSQGLARGRGGAQCRPVYVSWEGGLRSRKRTEASKRPIESVCCARVMLSGSTSARQQVFAATIAEDVALVSGINTDALDVDVWVVDVKSQRCELVS